MRKRLASSVLVGALLLARASTAQIAINEVLYNPTGTETGLERVELKNLGPSAVNIGNYSLCVQFTYGVNVPPNTTLPAGGFYVIHVNQAGTNTATDLFTGTGWLGSGLLNAADSFALYRPGGNFSDPDLVESFVQWGAANRPRENEAVLAGVWVNDTFAPSVGDGHSIEYIGSGVGGASWQDQANPTIGSENGSVPVSSQTWGKIKALYY
jgi:hypothetical protein